MTQLSNLAINEATKKKCVIQCFNFVYYVPKYHEVGLTINKGLAFLLKLFLIRCRNFKMEIERSIISTENLEYVSQPSVFRWRKN